MSSRGIIAALVGAAALAAAAAGGYTAARRNTGADPLSGGTVRNADQAPASAAAPFAEPGPAVAVASTDRAVERPAKLRPKEPPRPSPATKTVEPSVTAPILNVAPVTSGESAAPEAREARPDPLPPPDPPGPRLSEVTIATDSVIGIRLDSTLSSDTARVEDKVAARVTRDLVVDGRTVVSAGAKLEGVVSAVEHAGRFRDRSRLGVRFQSIVLADGTRLPIETETIFREGDSPAGQATTKVGASAAIGGILGAVIGGKKGAAIGSSVGAAGGTAAVMAGTAPGVILQAGTPLTVRLTAPVSIAVERQDN
jgi:hypothetical protein